ncbi:hypothetical protein C4D60_Mb08t25970 [Musa balbisiana]|uniref:Uncharacterized protein n=1 Tax=Musa balbisiana TaxID=52838 RepID=A0A4S8K6I3_MUSBA|nr:hypothetical protein C4D60_Mb08t25970 [Musa balbisiana]
MSSSSKTSISDVLLRMRTKESRRIRKASQGEVSCEIPHPTQTSYSSETQTKMEKEAEAKEEDEEEEEEDR